MHIWHPGEGDPHADSPPVSRVGVRGELLLDWGVHGKVSAWGLVIIMEVTASASCVDSAIKSGVGARLIFAIFRTGVLFFSKENTELFTHA
jgi:hypothetical protein